MVEVQKSGSVLGAAGARPPCRGVLAGLVGIVLLGPGPAALAATETTVVSGSLGKTFQTCLLGVTTTVGGGENCTYGGVSVSATQPFGENIGPLSLGAYYSSTTVPQAYTDPNFVPSNGDGKVAPAIAGTITVDDNGTPGNGADDLLSFTLTLTDPLDGNLIRVTNNFAERFASLTQVLVPRTVDAATPNGAGGFDYVIGATGFPNLLTYNQAPCAGQALGSMECSASVDGAVTDPLRWTGWPATAGLGSLEGNTGAKTQGAVTGLQCVGTAGAGVNAGTICNTSQVAWAPLVIGPNNTGGGSSDTVRGSAEDVGWDQLLLRVSTNAAGQVTTVAGFDVEDYRAFGPVRCGDNTLPSTANPATYTPVCNSWHSSYLVLAGVPAIDAVDDGPIAVLSGATTVIDVLANDLNLGSEVTVTIATPPAQGVAVVTGSPGDPADIRIEYTADGDADGADSFAYTVGDGDTSDTATVTLTVSSAIPVAADGAIALSTQGVDPAGLAGTFNAPGPGGSLGAPGAAEPVAITVQGARGTATVAPGGTLITYTVTDPTFLTGTDTFTYEITDAADATDTGVVTVTIADITPVLSPSVLLANQDQLSAPRTLALTPGNGAPGQHTLAVTTQGANGLCSLTAPDATGQLRYQPDPAFVGNDTCQVTVTDADGDSTVGTINVTVSRRGTTGGASASDGGLLALLGLVALRRQRRTALLATLGSVVGLSLPAGAQQPGSPGPTPTQGPGISEIIVTTRKVAENIKDVPLSITAFDSDTIQKAGITNLTDIAELTPGFSFFNAFGENLPVPVTRGVAPTNIFGENNTAVFIDGVYISGREGLNFSQLDVERIEVVKGPQSAQYGRNAFSGAINYVTKDPGLDFEGRTVVEAGNDGKRRGLAMVSGPIIGETLRGRISYQYDEWDGSYDNKLSDVDVGGYRYRSIQGKLLWQAAENLRFNLAYYTSNDRIDDPAAVTLPANCEDRVPGGTDDPDSVRLQSFCGEIPSIKAVPGQNGSTNIAKSARATGESRFLDRVILRGDWDIDGVGTLTSLTGYSKTEQRSVSDFTRNLGDSQPFLYCETIPGSEFGPAPNSCGTNPANLTFFSGVINPDGGDKSEEWSQELRFATDPGRRWRAVMGAFAFSTQETSFPGGPLATRSITDLPEWPNVGFAPFENAASNFAIGSAIFYTTFRPDGGLDPLNRRETTRKRDGWAAFSGLDFDLTDRIRLRGEVRYSYDSLSAANFRYQRCFLTGDLDPPPGTPCPETDLGVLEQPIYDLRTTAPSNVFKAGERFDAWVGRIGMDFRINDDWLAYWSVAEGDKPGNASFIEVTVVTGGESEDRLVFNDFAPESLTAYEVGLKGMLFDRLSLDLAVFYNDWRDIVLRQLLDTDPDSGLPLDQPTAFERNSGTARVLGAEFSASLAVTDDLSLSGSLGWTDSELRDAFVSGVETFPSFAPSDDVSGNKLLRQPEWDASFSAAYQRELKGDWSWYARGDVTYQSGIYATNDNQATLPERTYVNGRLGLRSSRYSVELWGRNLFNDTGAIAAFRDISFANTDSLTPPYADQGPRPTFDKFVPWRYTVTYPRERTYGVNFEVRFGGLVQ